MNRRVGIVDERLETLRVAGGQRCEPPRLGAAPRRIAHEQRGGIARTDPPALRVLLIEHDACVGAVHFEPQSMLAARRYLADRKRDGHAAGRIEPRAGNILSLDRPVRRVIARGLCRIGSGGLRGATQQPCAGTRRPTPLAAAPFDEIASVRANVRKGARRAARVRIDAPVRVVLARCESGHCEPVMGRVRHADIDHVDRPVVNRGFRTRVGTHAESVGRCQRARWRQSDDAADRCAGEPRGAQVDLTYHARADDRRCQVALARHPLLPPSIRRLSRRPRRVSPSRPERCPTAWPS